MSILKSAPLALTIAFAATASFAQKAQDADDKVGLMVAYASVSDPVQVLTNNGLPLNLASQYDAPSAVEQLDGRTGFGLAAYILMDYQDQS